MKKEIYIMLTRGNDGKFAISTYNTFNQAKKALESHLETQQNIEGVSGDNVYIDYHTWEALSVPGFVLRYDDVLSHVTLNISANGKVTKTDRYIIKSTLNGYDSED